MNIENMIENTIVEYYKELYADSGDITLGDLKTITTVDLRKLAWKAFETFKRTETKPSVEESRVEKNRETLYSFAKTLIGRTVCYVEPSLKMLFREAPKLGLKFFYGTDEDGLLEAFVPTKAKIVAVGIEKIKNNNGLSENR